MAETTDEAYDLERIRVHMRSGNPFTASDLLGLMARTDGAIDLMDSTMKRFHAAGYIETHDCEGTWKATEFGLSHFAPPYEVPARGTV